MDELHTHYLRRALSLARRGTRSVRPNPLVGAVLVRDGKIVGTGWHERAGGPHAEVRAIASAAEKAAGATLYVTLEPCNHHGRTGPCTDAISDVGIREVFFCSPDPNPNVEGGGAAKLRSKGISVTGACLSENEQELNAPWYHWLRTKRPLVTGLLRAGLNGLISEIGAKQQISPRVDRLQCWYDLQVCDNQLRFPDGTLRAFKTSDTSTFLRTLGGEGYQSLLVRDFKLVQVLCEQGMCDRLVVVHEPALSRSGALMPQISLELLRVRRDGNLAISVYRTGNKNDT